MKLKLMLVLAATFLISIQIAAQDLIFKKSGEIVKAKILSSSDETLSYQLYKSIDSLTYFINIQAIDSVISQNGTRTLFKKVSVFMPQQDKDQNTYNTHHLIGLDIAGFAFYRNLTLSYEFQPGKANLGFKATFTKNVGSDHYYSFNFNFSRVPDWSTRVGINYYVFPPRIFRFGAGLCYIFGKYSTLNYYSNEPYPAYVSDNESMSGVIGSVFGFYNLNRNLAINFGFDSPLYLNPDSSIFYTVFRCEILLNF